MFLIDPDEDLTYEVGGATFRYDRLLHADLAALRYLYTVRGVFDDDAHTRAVVAVALRKRGWTGLRGADGEVPWPLAMPASAIGAADAEAVAFLATLSPSLSHREREELHGALWVVNRLPGGVVQELAQRVQLFAPEALEKKYTPGLNGSSASEIPAPA